MAKRNPDAVITLEIRASFDTVPGDDELREILDSIRNYGGVDDATLKIAKPMSRDLVADGV